MFLSALNAPVACASFRSEIIKKYVFFEKLQMIYYLSRKKTHATFSKLQKSKLLHFQKSLFQKHFGFSKMQIIYIRSGSEILNISQPWGRFHHMTFPRISVIEDEGIELRSKFQIGRGIIPHGMPVHSGPLEITCPVGFPGPPEMGGAAPCYPRFRGEQKMTGGSHFPRLLPPRTGGQQNRFGGESGGSQNFQNLECYPPKWGVALGGALWILGGAGSSKILRIRRQCKYNFAGFQGQIQVFSIFTREARRNF